MQAHFLYFLHPCCTLYLTRGENLYEKMLNVLNPVYFRNPQRPSIIIFLSSPQDITQ